MRIPWITARRERRKAGRRGWEMYLRLCKTQIETNRLVGGMITDIQIAHLEHAQRMNRGDA